MWLIGRHLFAIAFWVRRLTGHAKSKYEVAQSYPKVSQTHNDDNGIKSTFFGS